MVQIEYLPIVLTGIGIIVSILYYTSVLRSQNTTREAQLFMTIYNNHIALPTQTIAVELMHQWDWEDYDDFMDKYALPNNLEAHAKWTHYFSSLEGLGILLRKGLIDSDLIYSTQYGSIIMIWERFFPIIEVWRETAGSHLYEDPEFLYNEMIRMRTERGHPESIGESRKLFTK
jgi:hypothetical protein